MEQRTALWAMVVLMVAALVGWFTRPTPTYTAVPFGSESQRVMIINTITGEAVKSCNISECVEMLREVRPHPRSRKENP